MDREGRRERAVALAVAVAAHACVLGWLSGWQLPHARRVAQPAVDDPLIVEFIVRPARSTAVAAPGVRERAPAHREISSPTARLPVTASRGADVQRQVAERPTLDLRVPSNGMEDVAVPRDAFARETELPGRATRFERNWAPAGTALDVASWRSPMVRAAIGLFGGPPRKCDEVERRLRVPDCLPDESDFERR